MMIRRRRQPNGLLEDLLGCLQRHVFTSLPSDYTSQAEWSSDDVARRRVVMIGL